MKNSNQNPWAGLASYEDPAKSKLKLKFCGRDNDIYDVARMIDDNLLLILYGKSGIGKTSLLNAGVFPKLRLEQYLPVSLRLGTLEDGTSYQEAIISAVKNAVEEVHGITNTYPVVEEQTDNQRPDRLWNFFARNHFSDAEQQPLFPVVVLDQFEEVLRNISAEHVVKVQTLLNQLQYLIDESHALSDCIVDGTEYFYDYNFRFVISIREDELYLLEDNIDNLSLSMFRNCRYRLRSMKPNQARQVISIGIDEGCIKEEQASHIEDIIIDLLTKGGTSSEIDPLLLSLICSKTFSIKKEEFITQNDLQYWGDGTNLLEKYYEDATSGLNTRQKSFLQSLVTDDSVGTRKRSSKKRAESQLGPIEFNKLTKGDNILLTVNEASSTIELIHDMLCPVIQQSKEDLIKKKNDAILSLLLGIIALFGVYSLHNCLFHLLVEENSVYYYALSLCSFFIFAPIICTSLINQIKTSRIATIILTALIIVPTIIFRKDDNIDTFVINIAYVMCAFCLAFFLFAFRKQEFKETKKPWDSIPLKLYFFIMLSYLFIESVFGSYWGTVRKINYCIPARSSWGLFLLPIFAVHITNRILNNGKKIKPVLVYGLMLITLLLACNAVFERMLPLTIIILLFAAFVFCLWFVYRDTKIRQKTAAIALNTLVLLLTFACNLGFNVFAIKYSSVKQIYPCSWTSVLVQDSRGKTGILGANGDTIVPCILQQKNDSINFYVIENNTPPYYDGLVHSNFNKDKADTVIINKKFMSSLLDIKLKNANLSKEDKIYNSVSFEVFKELRSAIIRHGAFGVPYDATGIPTLDSLTNLQNKKYLSFCDSIKKKIEDDNPLLEKDMQNFVVNLTRNLYVLHLNEILADSLNKLDYTTKQNIMEHYLPILLPIIFDEGKVVFASKFSFDSNHVQYSEDTILSIQYKELQDESLIGWFKMLYAVTMMDVGLHVKDYEKSIYHNLLMKATATRKDTRAVNDTVYSLVMERNEFTNNTPLDEVFKRTITTAFQLLSGYITNDPMAGHSERCIQICEYLYVIGRFRNYEMDGCTETLDSIIKEKKEYYDLRLNKKTNEDGIQNPLYYSIKATDSLLYINSLYDTIKAADSIGN